MKKTRTYKYPSLFRDWEETDFQWKNYFRTKCEFHRRLSADLGNIAPQTLDLYASHPTIPDGQMQDLIHACQIWQSQNYPQSLTPNSSTHES
jgi:hypothetical protein